MLKNSNPECGRRLGELIASSGMTREEFAKMLPCNPQHISNIVCGRRNLTLSMAQRIISEIFPEIRLEWLLCIDNFKTPEEKEEYSKDTWEEHQKVELLHDKAFRLFIDGIEDLCGYGLHSQGTDLLIGDYIAVSDSTGEKIGIIPQESFQKLQSEVENYTSYLIQRIIKAEMTAMPGEGKEGIEKWLTSKSAGTNPAS